MNNFNKVAGYKLKQKSVAFPQTNDTHAEKRKPLCSQQPRTCFRINLTNQGYDRLQQGKLYTLEREPEEDARRQKDFPCLLIGTINNGNIVVLPKATYTFNETPPSNIPTLLLTEIETTILRLIWKHKCPR